MSQPLHAVDLFGAYGDETVLSGVDLLANPGEPVGVVGENGVGKSTLLRLVAGVEEASSGFVQRPGDLGYLAQELAAPPGASVAAVLADALAPLHTAVCRLEQLAHQLDDPGAADAYADTLLWAQSHDAWDADRRALLASQRLGISHIDPSRPVSQLSGGERTRLAMAAVIARRPECVVLDEPTNHLDDDAVAFLEDFLRELPGVVLVASHDRVFLDRVCAVIVDLDAAHFGVDGQGGNRYSGGFTAYLAHKAAARRRWERAFAEQQEELNELRVAAKTTARQVAHNRPPRDGDKYLYHFKGGNVQATIRRRVRDAEHRIEVIERDSIPKPPEPLSFSQPLTAKDRLGRGCVVVSLRDVSVPGRLCLDRLDVSAGQHLLVTGANGSGKSTLLQLVSGRLEPASGLVRTSARRIGMLPQEVGFVRPRRTPQEVYDAALPDGPVPLSDLGLLHPRELSRPVGVLSTGQQRRLALAILVAGRADLLLLDEPTNHISLALASELENALDRSPGALMVASHDRWLRRRWDGPTYHLQRTRPA